MYRSVRTAASAIVVLAIAAAFAACDIAVQGHGDGALGVDLAAKAHDQWTRTYNVPAGGLLELININGKITAQASDGDTVELTGDRTAKAGSDEAAKDFLSRIEMREEVSDSRVRVEVRPPSGRRGFGHEITWTIKVPKGVNVDLRTVNGGVHLDRLRGDVRARATNGGIKGEGLAATNVDASVTNGGIEIELASATNAGSIELESVNGGVALSMPGDSRADISARCVNGGIDVHDLNVEVVGEKSRRRMEAKLNGGGARVDLETVNGGVRLSGTRDQVSGTR
jgi:putative adhesin